MKIMVVDNNIGDLEKMTECLIMAYSGYDEVVKFSDPLMAVKYGVNNDVDILYTEINMRGIDGFSMIELLKKHNPKMIANIVTSTNEYKGEAVKKNTAAYLLKPVSIRKVKDYISKSIN